MAAVLKNKKAGVRGYQRVKKAPYKRSAKSRIKFKMTGPNVDIYDQQKVEISAGRMEPEQAPKLTGEFTLDALYAIPTSTAGEFEVSDKKAKQMRKLIYGVNKDGIRRYRTMRDGRLLQIWRIK